MEAFLPRALSYFSNRSSTLRWSAFNRAMASVAGMDDGSGITAMRTCMARHLFRDRAPIIQYSCGQVAVMGITPWLRLSSPAMRSIWRGKMSASGLARVADRWGKNDRRHMPLRQGSLAVRWATGQHHRLQLLRLPPLWHALGLRLRR